jgi:23S rRNA pseudouridine2605 synthase
MNRQLSLVVFLARAGLGSRRACDELVRSGVVTVDGVAVDFPRHRLSGSEVVAVNGEPVEPRELRYLLVNKPRGVASTRRDPHADRVIVDLVPDGRMLFPVGRLDVDTTGLIILTNDGVLANHLMHPRYGVPKTYVARVRGKVSRRSLGMLRQGIELDDGLTAPAEVNLKRQSAKTALVEITIHEGRKRQVRRMFEAVGLPVEELHRRRYGPLTDKALEPGACRELTDEEVEALRRAGEEVVRSVEGETQGEPLYFLADAASLETEVAPVVTGLTHVESQAELQLEDGADESEAAVEVAGEPREYPLPEAPAQSPEPAPATGAPPDAGQTPSVDAPPATIADAPQASASDPPREAPPAEGDVGAAPALDGPV